MKRRRRLHFLLTAALIAAALYTGLQFYLHQMVKRHLQTVVQATPAIEDIRYARLNVRMLPFRIELRQVALQPAGGAAPIPISQVHLDHFQPGRKVPDRLALSLNGIRVQQTHPTANHIRNHMQRLGIRTLVMDLHIRLAHDERQKNAWRGHVEIKIQQAGILRIAMVIENLDADGVLQALDNPLYWMAVLPPVGIRKIAGEFENGGLVERIVADRTRRTGLTPAGARQQIRKEIEVAARKKKISPLGGLLSEFVADPVRIGYYTGNPEPVYLGGLLWSRRVRDWLKPLLIRGYRASTPRVTPWTDSAAAMAAKPPLL